MSDDVIKNELYLAVLPLIPTIASYKGKEEFLTLFPDKNFASSFFPDEVESFVALAKDGLMSLQGGHVIGYQIDQEQTDDGRVILKVTQYVR